MHLRQIQQGKRYFVNVKDTQRRCITLHYGEAVISVKRITIDVVKVYSTDEQIKKYKEIIKKREKNMRAI